jgi:hypothetical protein
MNFSHLLDSKQKRQRCRKYSNETHECYWIPTGNIRSTIGNNINVTLCCRNCGRIEDVFLTSEQFKNQEEILIKQIDKERKRVQARQ